MPHSVNVRNLVYDPALRGTDRGVLKGVTFNVARGEFVSLVGRNGHGKTSIIRAIAGELEQEYTQGDVLVDGLRVDRRVADVIPGVGIVHQFIQWDLYDDAGILSNILMRQMEAGVNVKAQSNWQRWATAVAGELAAVLESDDLAPDLEVPVSRLSGGQRQLLNVFLTLRLEQPYEEGEGGKKAVRLLLLDEHLTSLDYIFSERVVKLIDRYTLHEGKRTATIIIVTHDLDLAIRVSDRVLIVRDGRIAKEFDRKRLADWNVKAVRDAF